MTEGSVRRTSVVGRRLTLKNADSEVNFVPNKKAGPQFAFANEEPAYRSAVQNSPAICVFYSAAPPNA